MERGYKKKKMSDSVIIALIVLVIVIGGAGILWSIMSNGSESYTSSTSSTRIDYLNCKIKGTTKNAFFASNYSSSSSHEVKISFSGGTLQKLTYTYNGTFANEEIAQTEIDKMRADLYDHLGKTNMYPSDVAPGFSVDGAKGVVNIFMEGKFLNKNTARLFFLDEQGLEKIGEDSANRELRALYEGKGFTCSNGE